MIRLALLFALLLFSRVFVNFAGCIIQRKNKGGSKQLRISYEFSKSVRGTYNNFSRIGWSLAVSWVIVANHLGWGGPIATFMDHPLWQPLGRLSYCAYITHYYIIQYVFNLDDRPTHYVSIWQSYVYRTIPIVALSYLTAFFWSCLFEVPTTKLEKMLFEPLTSRRPTQPTNAKSTNSAPENGVCVKGTNDLRL
ncbi:hypothetical protein COOONC_14182 [Cooperia oncophora]